jgi:hypothetical protein
MFARPNLPQLLSRHDGRRRASARRQHCGASIMPARCRQELGVEDGFWIGQRGPSELLVVFASAPVVPGMLPTARFVRHVLAGRRALREPEQVLETLHHCAGDESLLSAVAVLWRPEQADVAWIGSVRGHLIRGGRLVASTRDHTLANELASAGSCEDNPALARIVTRSLGGPSARPDSQTWSLRQADALLLCAPRLHDFRPPARYLQDALEPRRSLPGRLLIEHRVSPGR